MTTADHQGAPRPDWRDTLHSTSVPPEYVARAVVFLASDFFSLHTTGSGSQWMPGESLLTESGLPPSGAGLARRQ